VRAFLVVLFVLLPLAATAKDIPPLTGRIVDQANLLTADQKQRIEAKLAAFEKETTDQVAVLTLDSLDGEAIEDYANKVGRAWALGQKGKDNGVLLLVAKQDRKMRIEVGYGLEGALPDALAHRIQEEEILPRFRNGDYAGGIEAGMTAIMAAIKGEYKGSGKTVNERGRGRSDALTGCLAPGLILFLIFIILPAIARRQFRSGRSHGGRGWWNTGGWGGWGGGGFGGGGWGGGGGFSGGGFSGGGGSFGGGGSSGSW
jgi:uncharacterized protein